MRYWLVSLPLVSSRRDRTWEILQEKTSTGAILSTNYKLELPELKVGTLDTLMALSDDLVKVTASAEAFVNKVRRTVADVAESGFTGFRVENRSVEDYVTHFRWEEAKFPSRRPLKESIEKMVDILAKLEDDLKVKMADYNNVKTQLSALARKTGGSLAVRDIASLVKPTDVVESENLTTLFVVVSTFGLKEWQQGYEKLTDYVVPRSTKVLMQDNDYSLVTVVLFKRVADAFKTAARAKGYQIREYSHAQEGAESATAAAEHLKGEVETRKAALETWGKTAFGEAFSCWLHILSIRLFVESILRYGLPPQYLAAVLKPGAKSEQKLRTALASIGGGDGGQYWKDGGETLVAGVVDSELYPYVSYTVSLE